MSAGLVARVWAIADAELKETRLLTLLSLAGSADDDGRCRQSVPELARLIRVSDRQIQRVVQWLDAHDYLKIIEKGNGRANVTLYLIAIKGDIGDTLTPISPTERVTLEAVKGDFGDVKGDMDDTLYSHARLGRLGRSLTTTEKKKPTYLPKSSKTDDPPLEPMQQLALDLLVDEDVGIFGWVADEIVRMLPLPDIYRAVDQWLPDPEAGPGALAKRLRKLEPSNAPTVNLSAKFRDSELFHRHRLPDEMMADGRKRYSEVPEQEPRKRYQP